MDKLTKRLEIRLDSRQLSLLTELAKRRGRPVSEVAREAIEEKLQRVSVDEKMAAFEMLGRLNLPVGDWEQMEREIEAGGQ